MSTAQTAAPAPAAPGAPRDRSARLGRWGLVALVVFVGAIPLMTANAYLQTVLILTFVVAVTASGWNVMAGFTGYVSLGHSAFIGVGAYTAGILSERLGVSPFLVAPLGGVAAAFVAFLLSLVTRRTRGAAFVIVSFAILELLGVVTRNWSSVTGGSQGLLMPLPDWDIRFQNWPFYYPLFALVLASVAMTSLIRRSKLGLGLVAIRDDEDKAAGIGVLTPVYKSLAFMASAVFVGMAGAIYGYYVSFLTVGTMFDVVLSMQVVLAALLGGRGTVWGPVLGAFIIVPLSEVTNTAIGGASAGAIRLLLFGGLLVAVTLLLPRGILPEITRLRRRRDRADAVLTGSRLADRPVPPAPASARMAAAAANPTVLSVRSVTKRFGGLTALQDVSLEVSRGSVTALIGPNGSGKTTLFNVIDGTYVADSGELELSGRPIGDLDRTRRAFAGIARTYQLPRLFESLTVLENVAAVNADFNLTRLARSAVSGAEAARALEFLDFVGMAEYVDAQATDLSYGQRKLVELAQVLMLDPDVILLDEPAAGINPTLLRRLASLIKALNQSGRSFLVVEHDIEFVLALSDTTVVLAQGQVIAHGPSSQISAEPAVREAYLGQDFTMQPQTTGTRP